MELPVAIAKNIDVLLGHAQLLWMRDVIAWTERKFLVYKAQDWSELQDSMHKDGWP